SLPLRARWPLIWIDDPFAENPGCKPATSGTKLVWYLVTAWARTGSRVTAVHATTARKLATRLAFIGSPPSRGIYKLIVRCALSPVNHLCSLRTCGGPQRLWSPTGPRVVRT